MSQADSCNCSKLAAATRLTEGRSSVSRVVSNSYGIICDRTFSEYLNLSTCGESCLVWALHDRPRLPVSLVEVAQDVVDHPPGLHRYLPCVATDRFARPAVHLPILYLIPFGRRGRPADQFQVLIDLEGNQDLIGRRGIGRIVQGEGSRWRGYMAHLVVSLCVARP